MSVKPVTTPHENMKQQIKSFSGPKDWPEDYGYENGTYTCKCCECDGLFIGYKRRVVCKECSNAEN